MQTWRCSAPIWPVQEVVRVSGWWERKQEREQTKEKKVEGMRAGDEHSVETGECVLAFDFGCCFKTQKDARLAAATPQRPPKVTAPHGPYFYGKGGQILAW